MKFRRFCQPALDIHIALDVGQIEVAQKLIVTELLKAGHSLMFVELLIKRMDLHPGTGGPKKDDPAWLNWPAIGSEYIKLKKAKVPQYRMKLAKKFNIDAKIVDSIGNYYERAASDGIDPAELLQSVVKEIAEEKEKPAGA